MWIRKLRYFYFAPCHFTLARLICISGTASCFAEYFLSSVFLSSCVPTVLTIRSTGISTCCPSNTSFDLSLGPDLPWADQLYPRNLRHSTYMILTYISLLIPAFSLLFRPPSLSLRLRPHRLLLYQCIATFRSFGGMF